MNNFTCPSVTTIKNKKARMARYLDVLAERFPDARCELNHADAFQLAVATILSAQCTDKQVNKVTPALFEEFHDAYSLANADIWRVEELIQSTGFYKNKAKNIIGMASAVTLYHNGKIPHTMEELTKLPGVGRKTANVILGNIFNVPSMVVDTHVIRTANRLAFVNTEEPVKIEQLLEKLVPKSRWVDFSHQVILMGRSLCPARNPKCAECPMNDR